MRTLDDVQRLPDLSDRAISEHETPPGDDWCGVDNWESLLIWGYDHVRQVLAEPHLANPPIQTTSLGTITEGPGYDWACSITSFMDGPPHRELRTPTLATFSANSVEQYRDQARAIAVDLVTETARLHTPDLVKEVAMAYPLRVFALVLGAEASQLDAVVDHVSTLTRLWSYAAGDWKDRIDGAVPILDDLAASLCSNPQGIVAELAATSLSPSNQRALVSQMIVAGWETTGGQIAGLLYHLTRDANRWADLGRYSPEAIAYEALRYEPTAPAALRYADADCSIGDLVIPEGTRVLPSFIWASRDPAAYDQPNIWNPGRYEGADPAPAPLTTSGGRHACLGKHLAQLEITEIVRALRDYGPADGWTLTAEPDWFLEDGPRRPVTLVVA